ncbi:unnamed protein product [Caenorhabditis brenneri]
MNASLSIFFFFILIPLILCESPIEQHVYVGDDFKYSLDFEGGNKAIGVERVFFDEEVNGEFKWYYYFCGKATEKNEKKCGTWIDKEGKKVKGPTRKVTLTEKEIIVSKVTMKDEGYYTAIFEDNNQETSNVRLVVRTRPSQPPPKHC